MTDAYRDDLASIHEAGFGGMTRAAGPVFIDALGKREIDRRLVVDLGCGSGILSQALAEVGFDVLDIDISPQMIALARGRVPTGTFRVGSLLTVDLRRRVAVAAVGECLRPRQHGPVVGEASGADPSGPGSRRTPALRRRRAGSGARGRAAPAVRRGGGPGRARGLGRGSPGPDSHATDHHLSTDGRVLPAGSRDPPATAHPRSDLIGQLLGLGFRVRILRGYGPVSFPPAVAGFQARKP
jgi:Methyltransferase domain